MSQTAPHPEPLVLIIEDNERNRKLFRDLLRIHGLRTIEAETGADGIAMVQRHNPGVVLLDVQLPDIDGVTVLRRLKSAPMSFGGAVVALTAFAMKDDAERFVSAGFDGYISKPIEVQEFAGQVRAFAHPQPE